MSMPDESQHPHRRSKASHEDAEEHTEESEAKGKTKDVETQDAPVAYVDPYRQVIHPMELPANTLAAANYPDMTMVDDSIGIDPDREAQATAAIQASVDALAAAGTPVVDPRIGNTIDDPVLESIAPVEALVGPPENVTLAAIGTAFTQQHQIGFGVFSQEEADAGLGTAGDPKWERTTFLDSTTLTTDISAGLFPNADSAVPVVVGIPGGAVTGSVNFAFVTELTPPPEPPPPDPPPEDQVAATAREES